MLIGFSTVTLSVGSLSVGFVLDLIREECVARRLEIGPYAMVYVAVGWIYNANMAWSVNFDMVPVTMA